MRPMRSQIAMCQRPVVLERASGAELVMDSEINTAGSSIIAVFYWGLTNLFDRRWQGTPRDHSPNPKEDQLHL